MADVILPRVVVGLALVSAVFWIWWCFEISRGRLHPQLSQVGRNSPAAEIVVATILLWLLAPAVANAFLQPPADEPFSLRRVQSVCLANALALTGILIVARISPASPVSLGIHGRGWKRDLEVGVLGFAATALPVGFLLERTEPWRTDETQHSFLRLLDADPRWSTLMWVVAAAAIAAPLTEELLFRAVLQGLMESVMPPARAVVLVAVLFSVVHGFPDAVPLFPLALVLGWIYYRRRSLLAVVVVHLLFNATNLLLAVLGNRAGN